MEHHSALGHLATRCHDTDRSACRFCRNQSGDLLPHLYEGDLRSRSAEEDLPTVPAIDITRAATLDEVTTQDQ